MFWSSENVLQNVVSKFTQGSSQLFHVKVDGIIIFKSTSYICSILSEIQCIIQNNFVTEFNFFKKSILN